MKYLIIFIIICASSFLKAQSYQPLFDANDIYYKIFFTIPDAGHTDSMYLVNDSIVVNNKLYKKFSSKFPAWLGDIYLRADSLNEKLWMLPVGDSVETIIFDLSLNLGDSIEFGNGWDKSWLKVDSIYYLNNLKHVQLDLNLTSINWEQFKLTFIEGLGPNIGFRFYEGWFFWGNQQQLLCAYKDGIEVFRSADTCEYNFVGIEEKENNESVKLKRNPISDFVELIIDPLILKNLQVEIFDFEGKKLNPTVIYSSTIKADMSAYHSGIYLIKISNKNFHQTLKFLKY